MKKTIIGILLGIVTMLGGYGVVQSNIGAYTGFQNLTLNSTTTSATVNQKVLDINPNREYALITNDSDTVVYLYPAFFASYSNASTTLMANKGIRVNANGGTYEINPDNPYTGQVWLATTTADKKLLIIEK